jgi:hypothetical protein
MRDGDDKEARGSVGVGRDAGMEEDQQQLIVGIV